MMPNGRKIGSGSRWLLYHGTSTKCLKSIRKEDRLRVTGYWDPAVSLTTVRSVAEYWADNAVFGDRYNRPNVKSSGVVLVLDGERLLARKYHLTEFRDDVWGEGECDWENEIACWDDIEPFRDFLIAIEPVTDRAKLSRAAKADILPIAGLELGVMAHTIGKLVKGEITPVIADGVASAILGLRSALDTASRHLVK
jgi:hypothetical protein